MKLWQVLVLLIVAAGTGAAGYFIYEAAAGPAAPSLSAEVQTATVQRGTLLTTISAVGTVSLPQQVKLSFTSAGTIAEVKAEMGGRVKKGQVLAKLETRDLEQAVLQAEVNLKKARANLEKARSPYGPADLARTEAAVLNAGNAIKNAEKALAEAKSPYSPADLARTEAAVLNAGNAIKNAEKALEKARSPYTKDDIAEAEAAVKRARQTLANAQAELDLTRKDWDNKVTDAEEKSSEAVEAYKSNVFHYYGIMLTDEQLGKEPSEILPQEPVWENIPPLPPTFGQPTSIVEKNWEAIGKASDDLENTRLQAAKAVLGAESNLAKAESALKEAEEALETVKAGADPDEVAAKESQVASARDNLLKAEEDLAKMKAGADPDDVAAKEYQVANARANLLKAEEDLAEMKAGADPIDIADKEYQVVNAQAALDKAKDNLAQATITAPFDGIVAQVGPDARAGNRVGANTLILLLVDPSVVEVNALVGENDLFQVKPGQEVSLSVDALPNRQLKGAVKALSPLATRQSGVVSYQLVVGVTADPSLTLSDGLNVSASIVTQRRDNVLLVPNRAIKTSGSGRVVEVVVSNTRETRPVRLGESDGQSYEVLAGLQEGDKVVLQARATTSQAGSTPGMQGGGMQFLPGAGGFR